MSSLTATDKRYFETLLNMGSGYVLDFTDATFAEFFRQSAKIDIHSKKYQIYGTSKAKKMRSFWEQESDEVVVKVLSEILDLYETECDLSGQKISEPAYGKCREILKRLIGKKAEPKINSEDDFLDKEIQLPSLQKIALEPLVLTIIEARLKEAQRALKANANLSVIFLCGSALEGVLLGVAQRNPAKFNQTKCCPKDKDGKTRQFHEWSLAQLIDAACEIDLIKLDVKKFSHSLRDFRNYIHPYQQMASGFSPDEHTARLCFQVLKAALASLAGER
jgi:hypothetical protein